MPKAAKSICPSGAKLAIAVLLGIAILFGLAACCMPQVRERFVGLRESFGSKKGDTVELVHASWCGHCRELLKAGGEWQALKASLPGVKFAELEDSSAEGKAAIARFDIKGFPDIRVVMSGDAGPESISAYTGPRTAAAMKAWVLQNVDR